jgi:RNA polymerase sigma-70 factor, ECF subfamily
VLGLCLRNRARAGVDLASGRSCRGWQSRNRRLAVAEVDGPAAALRLVDSLGLDGYHLFHAVRGDLLARLGRAADARQAFQSAARLTQNQRERDYLLARRDALI